MSIRFAHDENFLKLEHMVVSQLCESTKNHCHLFYTDCMGYGLCLNKADIKDAVTDFYL